MKLAEKFGRLLVRLWPVWLPLLLVIAWPFARPIAREHAFGSPLANVDLISLDEIWGELFWGKYRELVNPLPEASTRPDDLNLQIWEWNWGHSHNEIRPKSQNLIARFPAEILVYALAIRDLNVADKIQSPAAPAGTGSTPADVARAKILAQKAAQLEPNNAYWWVQLAIAQELSRQPQAALRSLERAAKCPVYDNKSSELARRSLAAFEPRRALTWEEKRAVAQFSQFSDGVPNARSWGHRARALAARSDARECLRWSAALARIGDLMGSENVSLATANTGRIWQREAWSVGEPKGTTVRQRNTADFSERCALYAARNGRPDLAKTTRAQAARARATDALIKASFARSETDDPWLASDNLGATLRVAQIGGVMLMCVAIYLALWWLAANIFLWRGMGAPSSRRARVATSGGGVAALLAMAIMAAFWFWRESLRLASAPRAPQHYVHELVYASLGVFAFFAAPWLLALAIAAMLLWRERAQFALPPRVDLELQLSRFSRRLLRWALPLVVVSSALTLLVGWLLPVMALWFGWKSVDVLAWLPPDRNGLTGSLMWDVAGEPWMLLYGAWLCFLCLIGWFAKWRWGTPLRLRPLTHRALRAWKESLGCAVAWLMWVYLLLIVLSLPTRVQAQARLDNVLQRGEIAVLRDLAAR